MDTIKKKPYLIIIGILILILSVNGILDYWNQFKTYIINSELDSCISCGLCNSCDSCISCDLCNLVVVLYCGFLNKSFNTDLNLSFSIL
jgi:hypothetical protein